MEVLVNGKPLPEYFHDYKSYIEGKKDSVFTIRLKNNSGERVLFVPTVDGLSVLDGKDGSFKSGGYIVSPYSSMVVDGWRLSDNKVAEFYFSSPDKSYRKRKNMGNNLGSIGVAVFREKQYPLVTIIKEKEYVFKHGPDCECSRCWPKWPKHEPRWLSTSGSGIGAASAGFSPQSMNVSNTSSLRSVGQELGTGFGREVRSDVVKAKFEREDSPVTVMEIFYNSRQALEALGITFRKVAVVVKPSSFPDEPGYCERP